MRESNKDILQISFETFGFIFFQSEAKLVSDGKGEVYQLPC